MSSCSSSSASSPSVHPVATQLQPLHVYGLSASCLWCGCVEAGDKYGRSLLASNMYGLTPSRKGVFARLPAYLEASRAPDVFDRPIDSPQTAAVQTRNASAMAAMRKLGAASATSVRRKTLCDITNLRRPLVAAAHEGQQDGLRCTEGVDGIARLVKENSDLVKLLEERDKFVELSEAELQNLRLAYW